MIKLSDIILKEEVDSSRLYGYHVTSKANLEGILDTGLSIGARKMQGRGVYSFYDKETATRYANKGEIEDPIIVKFYVSDPKALLYLNMDIAKKVLGTKEYHLVNQIDNYFGGFPAFLEIVKQANPKMGQERLIEILQSIEKDNDEMSQRTFFFELIPQTVNDTLNTVWSGNYGIEFRINSRYLIKIIGYSTTTTNGGSTEFTSTDGIDGKIPQDSKYDIVRDFFKENPGIDTFERADYQIDKVLTTVRDNRTYDHFTEIQRLIRKLNRK